MNVRGSPSLLVLLGRAGLGLEFGSGNSHVGDVVTPVFVVC